VGRSPAPAVIVQGDRFDTESVTICLLTTDPTPGGRAGWRQRAAAEPGARGIPRYLRQCM